MSSSPTLLDPADRAAQRDEDAQYYRAILHELVEMATDIARTVHRHATAQQPTEPTPGAAAQAAAPQPDLAPTFASAFDRIARTIRRTIALARKLSEPDREAPGPKPRSQDRCAEDCDDRCPNARQRRTDHAETDALHAEPCERPEGPDFDADEDLDDDLDEQSLADLIASLRHDSGLATLTDAQLRQHRTPQGRQDGVPGDNCGLCARPAEPKTTQPKTTQPRTTQPSTADPPLRAGTGPPGP